MTKLGPIHASAVVLGVQGFLIVGPSGTGKSTLAMALMAEAAARGDHAALVADDRVYLTVHGRKLVAHRPETIRGLIELRGGGIGRVESIAAAPLHYALSPFAGSPAERIPDEGESIRFADAAILPLYRVDLAWRAPLAAIEALIRARATP